MKQIKKFTKEINNLKNNKEIEQSSNPCNLQFFNDIVNDSNSWGDWLNNSIILFKSINGLIYLIYSKKNNLLIFYDFINKKKIIEIKNVHEKEISTLKYYFDK